MTTITFALIGYLSGSVLYARVFARLFGKTDLVILSKDKNPGTSNAYRYGGFWCGTLTLIFDILKGFLPVFGYLAYCGHLELPRSGLYLVLAAPVLGHAFPLFFGWKGGKGIATTFGCLLGLLPLWQPVALLAAFFIFFSVVLRISPHRNRTLVTYCCTALLMAMIRDCADVRIGFLVITAAVFLRILTNPEEKEKVEVKLLWKH